MDFLDNLVLPQSAHHMVLLKYLLVLTYIIFIPYVSILTGSLLYSIYFNRESRKHNNPACSSISKKIIDQITFNKSIALGLGVLPLLSVAFCYAQLLHLTGVNVPEYVLFSAFLMFASILFIYTYKYSFSLNRLFEKIKTVDNEETENELKGYTSSTRNLSSKSGIYGLILLLITIYIFSGAVSLAVDSTNWSTNNSFIGILLSFKTLVTFLQFLLFSFLATSIYLLYVYFRPSSEEILTTEEREGLRNFVLRTGLIFSIILPLFIVITLFIKPIASLSGNVFVLVTFSILLSLFISNLIYFMIKESHEKYSSSIFFVLIILFALMVVKDQFAFDTSTKKQFVILASNYEDYQTKLKESMGVAAAPISGADIYNGKCIACHKFDTRLVGPAYNDVLPKYEGKKEALVKFVLNPVKVNPEFPSMPNQGLKPNEAEAIATYLLEHPSKK
ncbi:hypothetical protein APF79_08220 [bacterium BRH_c32]|nr:MAG: hypothetical protein APF79_08220 [bacterium BRH_c32]